MCIQLNPITKPQLRKHPVGSRGPTRQRRDTLPQGRGCCFSDYKYSKAFVRDMAISFLVGLGAADPSANPANPETRP